MDAISDRQQDVFLVLLVRAKSVAGCLVCWWWVSSRSDWSRDRPAIHMVGQVPS